ncbi:DMT family transporter [Geomonas sp. Red69]|uniref:DMT family transporter n=1 Tax=Geomonas diazotrophica TaxID=2843197 RepID=A0ABX8JMB3_9BACT|nr:MULTISPECIES: DMT family transporter [Geomonas]MBU5637209.1 DMT family transporter [Geomonas diazotrophica]QWV99503.1 DMT family transporter [Geomonas nitrogeniifigens]QXE88678.1 DMT family transporter [Geomonas nitrogeniifigens]
MTNKHLGAWFIAASAAGFATLGILIKSAFAGGANISTVLAGRFLLAGIFLFVILRVRGINCRLDRRTAVQLILMGAIGYGGMSGLYANAIHYLPASLTGMLLYTYPALVTILALIVGDERFNAPKGIALVVCSVGLVLLLGASFEGARLAGVLSVLGAAVIYSCYIIIGNRILKNIDPMVTSLWVCTAAGLAFFLYGLVKGELVFDLTPTGWLSIVGIAVFPTLFGVMGFFAGLRLIGATNASIISMLEPLITVLLSVILLGERVTPLQGFGGAVLLFGGLILQLWGHEVRHEMVTEV